MNNDSTMKKFVEEHTVDRHHLWGRTFSFTPGNGNLYEIAVIPVTNFSVGVFDIKDGYLVIDGTTGNVYTFLSADIESMLLAYYVNEKLLKLDNTLMGENSIHICAVTALVGYALGRTTNVVLPSTFGVKEN